MDAISALDLLEEDHTQVESLFEEFQQLDNIEEKKELALKICLSLRVHAQIEEEIFIRPCATRSRTPIGLMRPSWSMPRPSS